jgi:hypothetical protein
MIDLKKNMRRREEHERVVEEKERKKIQKRGKNEGGTKTRE